MDDTVAEWMAEVLEGPLYVGSTRTVSLPEHKPSISTVELLPESLTRPCATCELEHPTTWLLDQNQYQSSPVTTVQPGEVVSYTCARCRKEEVTFWFRVEREAKPRLGGSVVTVTVTKIGQWPEPLINPPRAVTRALGDEAKLYRKGLVSLQHGFGIGALAYMRRVVEEKTGELLHLLRQVADVEGDAAKVARIEAAKGEQVSQTRLKLAAEALPPALRVGGENPLSRLFDVVSADMHNATDEECAARAAEIREIFEHLFANLREQLDKARAFQAKLKGLKKQS